MLNEKAVVHPKAEENGSTLTLLRLKTNICNVLCQDNKRISQPRCLEKEVDVVNISVYVLKPMFIISIIFPKSRC